MLVSDVVVVGLPSEVSSRPPRQDGGRSAAPMEASVHRPAPPSKSLVGRSTEGRWVN